MSKIQIKRIKERVLKIQSGWNEGAPAVDEFRNTKKVDFDTHIAEAQTIEDEIAGLKAQIELKENERDNRYARLDDAGIDIRKGVEGHKDFGDDSALLSAMGFVRKSERKSGLKRGVKDDTEK